MTFESAVSRAAAMLRQMREERRISQLQLADLAGVNPSVVNRAERGRDARLSTWEKLFDAMGCLLVLEAPDQSEETADLLLEEAERRRERRLEGLRAGKRRY